MALDPNIALSVRPLQFEMPNQLAQYAQISQIQNAQQANRLHEMQMAEYERARLEEEGTRNFLGRADLTDPAVRSQLLTSYGKSGREIYGKLSEAEKAQTEESARRAKLMQDTQGMYQNMSNMISNKADAVGFLQRMINDPAMKDSPIAKIPLMQQVAKIPEDPQGLDDWKKQFALGATKYITENKPHYVSQNAGGFEQVLAMPGLGGAANVVPGSYTKKTATPGELMVDARARERLAAESATGVLSPQSLELAANMYTQTGQLPALGIGKGAANVKAQIMNRAAELATPEGTTAANAATNIIGAKQDVASQTQAVKAFSTGKQGQQVNAFNTAIDHLGTMDKLSDALQNGDIKAFNALGNVVARQTGQPAPTNFDAAKQIVTAEIIKAVVASGGGVTERQEAERNFAAANSPEALKGVMNTYKQLLGGQLKSLNLQYENTTGRKDFDKKLTPGAKSTLDSLRGPETPAANATKLTPADQQALAWATANPNDPRATQIKQRLGM